MFLGSSFMALSPYLRASLLNSKLSKHTNISAGNAAPVRSLQSQPRQMSQPSLTSSLAPYGSQKVTALPCIITPHCSPTSQLLHSDLREEHTTFKTEIRNYTFETASGLQNGKQELYSLTLR